MSKKYELIEFIAYNDNKPLYIAKHFIVAILEPYKYPGKTSIFTLSGNDSGEWLVSEPIGRVLSKYNDPGIRCGDEQEKEQ